MMSLMLKPSLDRRRGPGGFGRVIALRTHGLPNFPPNDRYWKMSDFEEKRWDYKRRGRPMACEALARQVTIQRPIVEILRMKVKKATGSGVVRSQMDLHSSTLKPPWRAVSSHWRFSLSVGAYDACQPKTPIHSTVATKNPSASSGFSSLLITSPPRADSGAR